MQSRIPLELQRERDLVQQRRRGVTQALVRRHPLGDRCGECPQGRRRPLDQANAASWCGEPASTRPTTCDAEASGRVDPEDAGLDEGVR